MTQPYRGPLATQGPNDNCKSGCHIYAWHCGRCGGCSGYQGHHWSHCKVTGTVREFHMCCPDNCELINPNAQRSDTRHHDALTAVSGAAAHLVQQWAEVSADGRNHLLSNLAKSLRDLESVEAKLGINIDGTRTTACTGCGQCDYCRKGGESA